MKKSTNVLKNVYTSGGRPDMKKLENVSKKNVYTSGEGSDRKKSKNVSKQLFTLLGRVLT